LTRERVPKNDAANGCDKQAVRMRSSRLTLFLWASPPRNFRHPEVTGKLPIVTRNLGNPTINLYDLWDGFYMFFTIHVLLWIVYDIGFATLMGIVNQSITGGHDLEALRLAFGVVLSVLGLTTPATDDLGGSRNRTAHEKHVARYR